MSATPSLLERQLRSAGDRESAARQLLRLVEAGRPSALPGLRASIDVCASDAVTGPDAAEFRALLRSVWQAAVRRTDTGRTWGDALVDALEQWLPADRRRLLDVLLEGPAERGRSAYAEVLAGRAERLLDLVRRLVVEPDGVADATAVAELLTRHLDDGRQALLELSPLLVAADRRVGFTGHARRVLRLHPDPPPVLAALVDAAVRDPDRPLNTVTDLLLRETHVDLPAVAQALVPRLRQWSAAEVDRLAEALTGFDDGRQPDLPGVLRRAADRRAVPEVVAGTPPETPARAALAEVLAAARRPRPQPAGPAPDPGPAFTDRNFRLVVINELMYEQQVLTPPFDGHAFCERYTEREIDGYAGPVPEILEHFAGLTLTPELLALVTELYIGPECRIWGQIYLGWGGEEEYFWVASFADVVHLPNLRRVDAFLSTTPDIDPAPLHERGIELDLEID